jgi:hypothetical protein
MKKLLLIALVIVQTTLIAQNTYMEKPMYNPEQISEFEPAFYEALANEYVEFTLSTDLSHLSSNDKKMLLLMFDIARTMDELFWIEANGGKEDFLARIKNPNARKVAEINYGPWNRLGGEAPLFKNVPEKPAGAFFYPLDMSKEEFENFKDESKTSLYTMIRRDQDGKLVSVPYHVYFKDKISRASTLLKVCSDLASDPGLKKYLALRAEALLTDDYYPSDKAWMEMKTNTIDFVVGPIENYEDQLFGYKAAHESFILIKDLVWSEQLEKISALLPTLQENLPVSKEYKQEMPGSDSDIGVYDVIYYGGDCNAGSKTIAINLPNDPKVQLEHGSRKLQLKNAMKAKFDNILLPIASALIDESQLKHVQFDAFFENTMYHEIAHGLGIKNTINGKGEVRTALKEKYSVIEEGKADILGLYMINDLNVRKLHTADLMNNYVTFMAGIFRSVRFGASSSHGVANLVRYNYFKEKGAFSITPQGKYLIDFEKMKKAVKDLGSEILILQGNGDYNGADQMISQYGIIDPQLQKALDSLKTKNIPVDVTFLQGIQYVELQ